MGPGLEAQFPARRREERGCGPVTGKDRAPRQPVGGFYSSALRLPGGVLKVQPSATPTPSPVTWRFFSRSLVTIQNPMVSHSAELSPTGWESQVTAGFPGPMYFFISALSFLEIWYTTATIPKMLSCLLCEKSISLNGCLLQMYFFHSTGISEVCLLTAMAFDRYLAICSPLHYPTIMTPKLCNFTCLSSCSRGDSPHLEL